MKRLKICTIFLLLGCAKLEKPVLQGKWLTGESIYKFDLELHITEDGITESYCYYFSNDTIYLDYGFPFVIEKLTESKMILSKNDGTLKCWYEFVRI